MSLFWVSPVDPDIALAMIPLFERGTIALTEYYTKLRPDERPTGTPAQAARMVRGIVTREDFVKHADLCFDHVTINAAVIHVLCAHGAICAVLDKRPK
jgi:hypothetical protein